MSWKKFKIQFCIKIKITYDFRVGQPTIIGVEKWCGMDFKFVIQMWQTNYQNGFNFLNDDIFNFRDPKYFKTRQSFLWTSTFNRKSLKPFFTNYDSIFFIKTNILILYLATVFISICDSEVKIETQLISHIRHLFIQYFFRPILVQHFLL